MLLANIEGTLSCSPAGRFGQAARHGRRRVAGDGAKAGTKSAGSSSACWPAGGRSPDGRALGADARRPAIGAAPQVTRVPGELLSARERHGAPGELLSAREKRETPGELLSARERRGTPGELPLLAKGAGTPGELPCTRERDGHELPVAVGKTLDGGELAAAALGKTRTAADLVALRTAREGGQSLALRSGQRETAATCGSAPARRRTAANCRHCGRRAEDGRPLSALCRASRRRPPIVANCARTAAGRPPIVGTAPAQAAQLARCRRGASRHASIAKISKAP